MKYLFLLALSLLGVFAQPAEIIVIGGRTNTIVSGGAASDNWAASGDTNSYLTGVAAMNALFATNNVGIGVAPSSSAIINTKGMSADTSTYFIRGLDSSSRLSTALYPSGRVNLYGYDIGGIAALYYLGSPANGNLGGHFAIGLLDSNSHQHTIGRFNAYITDVTATSMDSKITIGWMDNVNGEPAGSYAYQQPNKNIVIESDGMQIPPPLLLGTNYASAGIIRMPNFSSIRSRDAANATDISIAVVSSDDGLYLGNGASLVAFQPGGSTIAYFGTSALNDGTANTHDIGSSTRPFKTVRAATSVLTDTLVVTNAASLLGSVTIGSGNQYVGNILTPWVNTNNVVSLAWKKAPQIWEFAGITGEWTAMAINSGSGSTGSGDANDSGYFTGITGSLTNGMGGFRSTAVSALMSANTVALHYRIKTPAALSSDADGYELVAGFGDATTYSDRADGVWFYYLHSVSNGVWCGVISSNSVSTYASGAAITPPTVVANTVYDLLLEVDSTAANFWVSTNNCAAWSWIGYNATHIPTGSGRETGIQSYIRKVGGSVGTTSRTLSIGRLALWPQ